MPVHHKVHSTQIHSIGHDGKSTMQITFNGKGGVGSTYSYANVSPDQFEAFLNAPSKGKHFASTFKANPDRHPYTKLASGDRWPDHDNRRTL